VQLDSEALSAIQTLPRASLVVPARQTVMSPAARLALPAHAAYASAAGLARRGTILLVVVSRLDRLVWLQHPVSK